MTLRDLLAAQKLRPHTTSKRELDDLRAVVQRDLTDAGVTQVSADRRFATAYNAALQTATMTVYCAGYRTAHGAGHHQTTLEAAELALGTASASTIAYFDACRRKRNNLDYDRVDVASETEATQTLAEAQQFLETVEA